MGHQWHVGCAQTVPVAGDVQRNVDQHAALIRLAAPLGPDVLVFPELSLTGYELPLASKLAFAPQDQRLEPLRELAQAHRMCLLVGAPLQLDGTLFLGAFVIGPEGNVDIYTKQHLGAFPESAREHGVLPPVESSVFSSGHANPLVAVGEHPAAIAICADANRAEHAQSAAQRGARAYLNCAFTIPTELEEATRNLATHAREHAMVVAYSNYGGPSGGLGSAGQSAIWSNCGELLAQLPATGAGVLVAHETNGHWASEQLSLD